MDIKIRDVLRADAPCSYIKPFTSNCESKKCNQDCPKSSLSLRLELCKRFIYIGVFVGVTARQHTHIYVSFTNSSVGQDFLKLCLYFFPPRAQGRITKKIGILGVGPPARPCRGGRASGPALPRGQSPSEKNKPTYGGAALVEHALLHQSVM
jgi:hypothetical protein